MIQLEVTVNEALVYAKALKERLKEMGEVLEKSAVTKESPWANEKERTIPVFDVNEVDKRITEIRMALFGIDAAIKVSNAKVSINLKDFDFKNLMRPLERAK